MDNAAPRIVRHQVFRFPDFLDASEVDRLMRTVLDAQPRFRPSNTSDNDAGYRQSMVLQPDPALERPLVAKVRALMPQVIEGLRMRAFDVGTIECQVTANTDGSFFNVHTDAGDNDTYKRVLTYVYYFNRAPKAFEGGDLRVYDDEVRNGKLARIDSFQTFEPLHNSIVFFHSRVMHEVTPVRVPSREFGDSRFTVNGWVQKT